MSEDVTLCGQAKYAERRSRLALELEQHVRPHGYDLIGSWESGEFHLSLDGSRCYSDVEQDLVPKLMELGVVELPYYALGAGLLTGKYIPGEVDDSWRGRSVRRYLEHPRARDTLRRLADVARGRDASQAAVALAWLSAQPSVKAPIASVSVPAQLSALFESSSIELTEDELSMLSFS